MINDHPSTMIALLKGARQTLRQPHITPADAQYCVEVINEVMRQLANEYGDDDAYLLRVIMNGETR